MDESKTHLNEFIYNLVWKTNLNEENELICELYLIGIEWDWFIKIGEFD